MVSFINERILGVAVPLLLIAGGLYFCIKLRFFFILHPIRALRALTARGGNGGTSPFRALTLALAGTLGVGNIVGVSAAIYVGGFGAVLWMWISALCASVLKYCEIVLSMRHRRFSSDGVPHGSAAYYIRDCFLAQKRPLLGIALAALFALFCALNSVTMGSVIQTNAAAGALHGVLGIPPALTGAVLAVLAFFVVRRGGEGIAGFTEKLVPLMTALYVAVSLCVIFTRAEAVPRALALIFENAFTLKAGASGVASFLFSDALRCGVMRGLISNEAGCGTAPTAHAVASSESPCAQGLLGIVEVAVDTLVLCTLTALCVIVTWEDNPFIGENFIMMTVGAYESALGKAAAYIMSACVLCFAFATVVCLAHYGMESVGYLSRRTLAQKAFTAVYCAFVFVGAFCAPVRAWEYADLAIGVMTVINVPALLLCKREICEETGKLKIEN